MSRLSPFLKISLIYTALGCLWIIFSDRLVLMLFGSSSATTLTLIQDFKGIFYVIVTGILLYFLVKAYYRKHSSYEEKYKQFFYQNPSPMWVYDPKTLRFVDVNPSAQDQYGFSREEFDRMTIMDIRPEEEAQRVLEYVKEKKYQYKNAGVWTHKKKDGSLIFVNIFSNSIILEGRDLRVVCAIDVSKTVEYEKQIEANNLTLELKIEERTKNLATMNEELQSYNEEMSAANDTIIQQAETIKQQSENRLNVVLESITDGFFMVDDEGFIIRCNKVFLQLFELEGIPAGGNKIGQIFDCLDQRFFVEQIGQSLKNKENALFDIYLSHSKIWLEVRTYPNKEGLFVYLLDVTEFKEQKEALEFSQQNLDALINNTDDLIWSVNKELKLISINESFVEINKLFTGKTISVGERDLDFIEEEAMKAEWTAYYQRALHGEYFSLEQVWALKDRKNVYEINFNPINNDQNHVVGVGCFARDITQRKHSEAERMKLIERLTKQNRDLEEFAFITSHNLRAPVASILGLTHIFNKEKIDDPLNLELVDHLQTSAEKLDHVIADLSAILEMKSNLEDTLEVVNLQDVMDTIQVMVQQQIIDNLAEIKIDFTALEKLKTNKAYINNILLNLISNALKYKRKNESPRIIVKSFCLPEEVGISVQDNGKGIDLAQFGSQVFTLYKRFHLDVEGKGVGLYLVKTQVEALGGRVTIESKENEGALFTVFFPKSM